MNIAPDANPIPTHLRPSCANCGQLLDAWGCCPNVTTDQARRASTTRRPRYCDGAEDEKPFNIHDFERIA